MNLSSPPYLQIALDFVDKNKFESVLAAIPYTENILIEAGTPLIKKFGISILQTILQYHPRSYAIADLKTLDVGWLEVQIAAEENASAVAISGLASLETLESSLKEANKRDVDIILDMMNVKEPIHLLKQLSRQPKIVLFHRGIDQEGKTEHPWELIREVKTIYPKILVAVAGGLNLQTSSKALENNADVIVIGRAITQSTDVETAVNQFLELF